MRVTIRGKRHHGKRHQMHVSTFQKPSWIEWLFLFMRKGQYDYVGKGRTWYRLRLATANGKRKQKVFVQDAKPVRSKSLIKVLQNVHP